MIDRLVSLFPNFSHLQESNLEVGRLENFWQVTALDNKGRPLGSGYSKDLNKARKIAIAEFIERCFVYEQKRVDGGKDWMLDTFPTACGFAAGFDAINTRIRSTGEAIERWALAKWMDDKCPLELDITPSWPKESLGMIKDFEKVFVFKKEFFYAMKEAILPYHLCAFVGFRNGGAFVGSGVRGSHQEALLHALVEAHRHYLISNQERNFDVFPYNRIKYFADHGDAALKAINIERENPWPAPSLKFQQNLQNDLFCVSRTIFEDWNPWERGAIDRMLY